MQGNVSILAGSGRAFETDGVGEAAGIRNPLGATISPDATKLYVISGTPGVNALRVIDLNSATIAIDASLTGSWYDQTHDGEGICFGNARRRCAPSILVYLRPFWQPAMASGYWRIEGTN